MADNLIYRMSLVTDVSPWSAGDLVEGYWDDVAEDFVVKKNGSTVTSGSSPATLSSNQVDFVDDIRLRWCTGTTLTYFDLVGIYTVRSGTAETRDGIKTKDFPYATLENTVASAECQPTSKVCSMRLDIYKIIKPTIGATDGEIQVVAYDSGGSVEYSLDNFEYGNGENSDGVFSGLGLGTYNIYARDVYNCGARVTIKLNEVQEYGTIYRVEFDDLNGNTNRFDIQERDYSGSVTEVTSGNTPLIYNKYPSSVDNFYKSPINSSSIDVTLISDTNFKYRDLFTQDDKKYRGIWYLNIGAGLVEKWRGFLLPSQFSESYISTPYETTFTFIDSLEILKRYSFLEIGGAYYGNDVSIIRTIARCLDKTGLELRIKTGINVYSSTMNQTSSDDPLNQAFINNDTFYDEGEPISCYHVLEALLLPFGARIYQWENSWWITSIKEERDTSFNYRDFDIYGIDKTSPSSHSPQLNIDNSTSGTTRFVWSDRNQLYEIAPAYKQVSVLSTFKGEENKLNGNFSRLDFTNSEPLEWVSFVSPSESGSPGVGVGVENIDDINRVVFRKAGFTTLGRYSYIKSKEFNFELSPSDQIQISFDTSVDKLSSLIPFITCKYVFRIYVDSTYYYLFEDGNWTTSYYESYFNPKPAEVMSFSLKTTLPTGLTGANSYGKYEGVAQLTIFPYFGNGYVYEDFTALRAADTTILDEGIGVDMLYERTGAGGASYKDIIYYQGKISDEAESGEDIIRPDDYNNTTNPFVWEKKGQINAYIDTNRRGSLYTSAINSYYFTGWNDKFYIYNVDVSILIANNNIPEEELITIINNENFNESYQIDLSVSDVPETSDGGRLSNDVYEFNSFFKLANQDFINDWTEVNSTERIQKLLANKLARQYSTPTSKISGSLTNLKGTKYLAPYNVLKETYDGDKIYFIDKLTFNARYNSYDVELIELKSQNEPSAHTNGFKYDSFT